MCTQTLSHESERWMANATWLVAKSVSYEVSLNLQNNAHLQQADSPETVFLVVAF